LFVITRKTRDNISFDERNIFQGIYIKMINAININTDSIILQSDELHFLKNCFIETSCSVQESINLSKLQNEIMK